MKSIHKNFLLIFAIILFAGCYSKTDKDYFSEAQKKSKEKKFIEAVKDFEKLTLEYPNSNLAPRALYEIAKLYHAQLVPNFNREESLSKAVFYYKKVFKEYANSQEAERALFITGFIFANELYQLDSAKFSYELFLKKYPQSELTRSVKLELENLGSTPDEILNKRMKAKN